jgi:hypothetical protein
MEWLDLLIKIGGATAAIVAVWKGIVAFVRFLDGIKNDVKETKDYVMNNIKNVESIPTIEEHCRENYLGIKRLTVMSSDMPLGERIIAGRDYIKAGGNGDVKHYIEDELHINDIKE